MKLTDIVPKDATFKLSKHPNVEFIVRRFTAADEIWLQHTFGDRVQEIFRDLPLKEICQIVFHQLPEDQKSLFLKKSVTLINESGDSIQTDMGGFMLFAFSIVGQEEKESLALALLTSITGSRPEARPSDDEKKTQAMSIGGP